MLNVAKNWIAFENARFTVDIFYGICRTLYGLSKMALANIIVFVLMVLHNHVLEKNADMSKISKSVQRSQGLKLFGRW